MSTEIPNPKPASAQICKLKGLALEEKRNYIP